MAEEVKPGWTARYILLTVFVAVLSAIAGFFVNWFLIQQTAARKTALVVSPEVRNVIPNPDSFGPIRAKFWRSSDPSFELKSYFSYEVRITDDGGESLEDAELFVGPPSGVTLVKPPSIDTTPSGLTVAMHLTQQSVPNHPEMDLQRIGLLQRGQAISFIYSGYSSNYLPSSRLNVILQKKDWSPRYAKVEAEAAPTPGQRAKAALPLLAGLLGTVLGAIGILAYFLSASSYPSAASKESIYLYSTLLQQRMQALEAELEKRTGEAKRK